MHYIQKQILDELRTVSNEHYAALNKDSVESGHFRYHLSQLVTNGYVQQLERGIYSLTTKGQQYVDELSSHRIHAEKMPKVITYTLLTHGDAVLLQLKPKHPYKDLFNMVGGKVHLGERTSDATIREVKEKTGERITSPKLQGIFEIRIDQDDTLFTHVIAYVYQATLEHVPDSLTAIERKELDSHTQLSPDLLPILNKIDKSEIVAVDTLTLTFEDS